MESCCRDLVVNDTFRGDGVRTIELLELLLTAEAGAHDPRA